MHAYFLTRGINTPSRNHWVEFMSTRMFPWKRKNIDTGKWDVKMVKGALRPIELWEYVFPEECLTEVFAMQHKADGTGSLIDVKTETLRPEIKNYALLLQKLMKLDPIPKFKDPSAFAYQTEKGGVPFPVNWVPLDGFAVYPLGLKKDIRHEFPNFIEPGAPKGFYQEAL